MDIQGIAPNETQLLLDKKIAELQEAIRRLKRDRNEDSLIARLPPEILGKIFVIVASTKQLEGRRWMPSRQFNFSYVSEHWRNVALTTPEIWGTLPDSHIEWSRVMLERSQDTDLSLDFSIRALTSAKDKLVKEVLTGHGHRFKELQLELSSASTAGDMTSLLNHLPSSAPRLRTLRLSVFGSPATIPQGILADVSLSILELSNCHIDWKSPLMAGLRQLKIHNAASGSPSEILDALRGMPLLTHLELSRTLSEGDLASNALQVPLPHLLLLSISMCQPGAITNILRSLAIPMSAAVHLTCSIEGSNSQSLISALNTLFSSMTNTEISTQAPLVYRTLSLSKDATGYYVQAWHKIWTQTSHSEEESNQQFSFRSFSEDSNIVRQLVLATPLSNLKLLLLSAYIQHTVLAVILSDLPNLDTVVVDSASAASSFVKAIMHRRDDTEDSYYQPYLPFLNNLTMNNVTFTMRSVFHVTCQHLIECLIERVERGAPIQKLTISKAYDLSSKDVQSLEEIVPEVEWDEEELHYEESDEEDEEEDMYDVYGYNDYSDFDGSDYYLDGF